MASTEEPKAGVDGKGERNLDKESWARVQAAMKRIHEAKVDDKKAVYERGLSELTAKDERDALVEYWEVYPWGEHGQPIDISAARIREAPEKDRRNVFLREVAKYRSEEEKRRLRAKYEEMIGALDLGESPPEASGDIPDDVKAEREKWRLKFRERNIVDLPSDKEFWETNNEIARARLPEDFKKLADKYDALKVRAGGAPPRRDPTETDPKPKDSGDGFKRLSPEELVKMSAKEIEEYEKNLEEHIRNKGKKPTDSKDRPKPDDKTPSTDAYGAEQLEEIQKNLRDELENNSEVSDEEKKKLLGDIDRITNDATYLPVYNRIYYGLKPKKDGDTGKNPDKGGKKGGEPDTKKGRGRKDSDPEPGKKKTVLLSSGVFEITETDADGKTTTRLVDASGKTIHDTATEDELWKKAGYGEATGYKPTAIPTVPPPQEPTRPLQQIPPHRPAAPLTKFFRRLFGIYDRDPILESQLYNPNISEQEKENIRAREALTLGSLGISADAQDRSLKEQWKNVRDNLHLEGVARTVLISAAVLTILATAVGTGGLTLGWLGGVVAGKIARNVIEKRQKKDGETGKLATFKRLAGSSIIGIGAGVAIGLATGTLDWSAIWDRLTGGGTPTGPSDTPQPTSASTGQETAGWSPPAPKGFMPAEFNDLGQVLQLTTGGESVWDGITSGMVEHNLLDHQGRQAFAQAFHKTVDSGFRDLFLSCGGESVGSTPWNKLPAGTVANFEKLFNNPEFVEKFCANIGRNYPTLADKIDASGFTVKQFIRGYAYLHGARIP